MGRDRFMERDIEKIGKVVVELQGPQELGCPTGMPEHGSVSGRP